MSIFTIDAHYNITAHAVAPEASQSGAGLTHFDSQQGLAEIAAGWPLSRFVKIWNRIPGNTHVNRFQDRKTAVARIWKR